MHYDDILKKKGECAMTETRKPETMLPIESKLEAEEIREFLAMLTPEEEKDFRTFMYGVKFVKSLERTA